MKNIYKTLAFLILILNFYQLEAQTNGMNFTITSTSMEVMGHTLPLMSTIDKKGNSIIWKQSSGGKTNTTVFSIVNTSGQWDTTTGLGEISYSMKLKNNACTLVLTGTQQGIVAILSFTGQEQGDTTLNVNTISYQ